MPAEGATTKSAGKAAGEPMDGAGEKADKGFRVALSRVPGIGAKRLALLVEKFGSAREAWLAPAAALEALPDFPAGVRTALLAEREKVDPLALVPTLEGRGIKVLTPLDPGFPRLLREVPQAPPVLYARGDPDCLARPAVAVVGTRKPSESGREITREIAGALARIGVTVVSGLALGVDTAAHEGALEAGGVTVAVLGSGLDHVYPRPNLALAEEIRRRGAVISQFREDTIPDKANFARRNLVVAGLSLGVTVTEAPEGSGALITAACARELGRPVFAVPGSLSSPNAAGCLELLRRGARAVGGGAHVLEDLGPLIATATGLASGPKPPGPEPPGPAPGAEPGPGLPRVARRPEPSAPAPRLPGDPGVVLAAMGPGETVPFALLMVRSGLDAGRLGAALGRLEVRGLVSRQPGQCYLRK